MILICHEITHAEILDYTENRDIYCDANDKTGTPSGWGTLFWPEGTEHLEFYTADFSSQFSCEPHAVMIAQPIEACTELENDVKGKYVVVNRGTCSFQSKAIRLKNAGALGMILVNVIDNSLFAMPQEAALNPDLKNQKIEKTIPSVMVRERAGRLLAIYIDAHPNPTVYLVGQKMDTRRATYEPCGSCVGTVPQHLELHQHRARYGIRYTAGVLDLLDESFQTILLSLDGFVSSFGAFVPSSPMRLEYIGDENEFGCEPLNRHIVPNSALLMKRGICPFVLKLQHAYDAGARFVIFQNSDQEIFSPGVDNPDVLDPQKDSFVQGSLLASAIVFQKDGHKILDVLQKNSKVYIQFSMSQLVSDISTLKANPENSNIQCFDSDFEHATTQLRLDPKAIDRLLENRRAV